MDLVERAPVTWAVVRRAKIGDREAFAAIYRRYRSDVYKVVRRSGADDSRADDIVSETFVRALRNLPRVEERGPDIRAWILTIARNLIVDYYRSGFGRWEIAAAELPDRPDVSEDPEAAVERSDRQGAVRALVAKLNPEQRTCVELRFLRDLGVGETARAMDRAEGAVRALQYRALRNLATLAADKLPRSA